MIARLPSGRIIISGEPLVGFSQFFDGGFGDQATERPYVKVTPSRIGDTLLPFPCAHCGVASSSAVDPKKGPHYYDRDRGFSWCPACRKRYILDTRGAPLKHALPAGIGYAPAIVERAGTTTLVGVA